MNRNWVKAFFIVFIFFTLITVSGFFIPEVLIAIMVGVISIIMLLIAVCSVHDLIDKEDDYVD